jgi:hypothetical protein
MTFGLARGLAEFEEIAADVLRLLDQADLDQPVPSCPGWSIAPLAGVNPIPKTAAGLWVSGRPDRHAGR